MPGTNPAARTDYGSLPDFDGRRGGALLVIDAEQGEVLRRVDTDAAPAYDGMAAAAGRLYLATGDGRLLCFGQE